MNPDSDNWQVTPFIATDVAREQYYEELVENSRKKLATLRARHRAGNAQTVTMDILREEIVVLQAERELERLKGRPFIL
jgi:hypothetical protein